MENIDSKWNENLDKIRGENGIHILINDNNDIMSKLIKALADVEGLPDDLSHPETLDEVEAVNEYAQTLYDLFSVGAKTAEAMMVGAKVQRKYEDAMDERGETISDYGKMVDAGYAAGDF